MLKKIKISENSKKIAYKLASDAALILSIFFVLALLAETVLPGMVSGRRGFEIIVFLLVVDVLAMVYLAKNLGIVWGAEKKKKAIYVLLFLGTLIIISSLIKFGWVLMIPIVVLSAAVFYFLYKILIEEDR